jgi:agmatine deiminase
MTDAESNFVFLADTLPKCYPSFHREFYKLLGEHNIRTGTLPGTRDVWAKDYMPVQCGAANFIQFRYDPDYLKSKKWSHLRTNPNSISHAMGICTRKSDLIIDGGNVIRGKDFVILTDKIFQENKQQSQKLIVSKLESLLQKQVVIMPKDPADYTGHADGMIRLHRNRTVLINEYRQEDRRLEIRVKSALKASGIDWIEIPYAPYSNSCVNDATGLYINFLQLRNVIFLPVFDLPEDLTALDQFEQLFPGYEIIPLMSKKIAKEGGVLNCISWNIHLS